MDGRRQEIVDAARVILAEDPDSTLAVRTVAARVGIGPSTLRHYFPTQRALHEALVIADLDIALSDLRIHDRSVPAETRLRECLAQILPPRRPLDEVRSQRWLQRVNTVFGPGGSAEVRRAWTAFDTTILDAVAGWLGVLAAEGVVPPGSEQRGARFLKTVIDGLAVARILPVPQPDDEIETAALGDALATVLRTG
ncbi:TetR/AcrR family transcriptional regulator [Pseudonocardia sp. HH130630-07]|uniref:TetR/AcrR family transcriptional regulator n=1 Tax=Pseudonocardia sp. HH130630-07 TaxID=1690815 RepID=UPI0008153CE8|nr:TetR/AcrR family transcriptional regulator [Pseudonocardia sp. HH130630-07]ANY06154.1 hypothetical protein AFB00_07415 [Pseudonocardia sp. HH130630-07]